MGKGQAQGPDREYQAQCRDVLVRRDPALSPYDGEGIDVPFQAGGTTWTLDVALRQPTGELVVAECRRRKDPVKQEDLGAFAYKVEVLRNHLGVAVAGIFFAKTAVQLGAVKVGTFEGIEVAVVAEDQTAAGVPLVFHRYDEERAKRTRHYVLEALSGHITITGSLEAKLIRDGKVVEER